MSTDTTYTFEELDLLTRLPAHSGFAVMIAERAPWRGRQTEIRELRAAAAKTAPQPTPTPSSSVSVGRR